MTKEQRFFLDILGDHLKRRKTVPPEGIDWNTLVGYAESHRLAAIVYEQCRGYLSARPELSGMLEYLTNYHHNTVRKYVMFQNAFGELRRTFEQRHIRFLTAKGLEVAELFPVPTLREMGDLDIVTSTEDREAMPALMESLGYSMEKTETGWHFFRGAMNVEMHDRLNYFDYDTEHDRFLRTFWDYAYPVNDYYYRFDKSFHFVFLVDHLVKHFCAEGIGFRHFMDVIVYAQKTPDLNWGWIRETMQGIGLWDFTVNLFAVCRAWWGIDPPAAIPQTEAEEAFVNASTEVVFQNGAFGSEGVNSMTNMIARGYMKFNAPKPLRPILFAFDTVFRPYDDLIRHDYCSFLVGRKYLLPVGWVVRGYQLMSGSRDKTVAAMKSAGNAEERLHLKLRWGLK